MAPLLRFVVAAATLVPGLLAQSVAQLFQGQLSPGAQIFYPSDKNYSQETVQRWQVYAVPTYQASIKPATPGDVQKIVQIAGQHKIPFLATGGGHGLPTSLASLHNGIEIDMSGFKDVVVDTNANTVMIGGGVTYGDIVEPLYSKGKQIPIGGCPCVGFMGGMIGGGVGRYQGLEGLGVDNALELQVVTGTGELMNISSTQNHDLFWGMRGAGANLGIIVNSKFRIFDLVNNGHVVNADFFFKGSQNESIWQELKKYQTNQPPELAIVTTILYNATLGGTVLQVNVIYAGPYSQSTQYIQPFINMHPAVQAINNITWDQVNDLSSFGIFAQTQCEIGKRISSYTVNVKTLDVPTWTTHFNNFSHLLASQPETRNSTLFIETFATKAAPPNSSVVHFRDATNTLLWGYNYQNPAMDASINKFATDARSAFVATSGYGSLNTYVSYCQGDEGPAAWYGKSNLGPLQNLKKRYDPDQLFSYFNPIPFSS